MMRHILHKIWNMITTLLVAAVVILAVLLVGVRIFGVQIFSVLSGSMEPAYRTGSLIYVKQVDYHALKEGDVITFMLDEDTAATHRIVALVPDGTDPEVIRYRTKGDANGAEDESLVHYKNILGTPVFTIPKLGYLANYIQTPPGSYVTVCGGVILFLLVAVPDLLCEKFRKEQHPGKRAGASKGGKYLQRKEK